MFREDTGVLHRHIPATERNHLGAQRNVRGVQRSGLEWSRSHDCYRTGAGQTCQKQIRDPPEDCKEQAEWEERPTGSDRSSAP